MSTNPPDPRRLTAHTELFGLIAEPVRHSRSPQMHNTAFAHLGIDAAYLAFEVGPDDLAAAVAGLRAIGARGWNVSMPHKEEVIRYLDRQDRSVELIGTCNTVVDEDGVLTGYNTDGTGWVAALREHDVDIAGATVTVIGAGGASTAMITQAALDGAAHISVFNRKDRFYEAGSATVDRVNTRTDTVAEMGDLRDGDAFAAAVSKSSVLVNATGVGMKPLEGISPLPDTSVLRSDLFVSDVVYAPERSVFLQQAEAAGCRTMNGLSMMFHQGAESFRLFTGQEMPLDFVRARMDD